MMRKHKTKKLTNKVMAAFIFIPAIVGANLSQVQDAAALAKLVQILNTNQEQLSRLDDFNSEISQVNGMLGTVSNDNVITRHGHTVTELIFKTSSFSSDGNMALMGVIEDPRSIDNWKNLGWTAEEIEQSLFAKKQENGRVAYAEIDRVQLNRHNALANSTKSSMALAETRQASVKDTQKTVVEISKRSARAGNLHEDLSAGNQALMVIASEMVKQTEILAKLLELQTASVMYRNKDWVPPDKRASDPVAEAKREREYQRRSQASINKLKRRANRVRR
jgi:hypothetical protein